jgi:hypothetical protein
MLDRLMQTFPKIEMTPQSCPVCNWPLHPAQPDSARYGAPDAEDEESVSEEPYLHALADVVRLGSVKDVPLCTKHGAELAEIVTRDATGQHPKRDPDLIEAERRAEKAREALDAAEEDLDRKRQSKKR